MKTFFEDQVGKIAWRRIAIIAFVWTVFAMQSKNFKDTNESVAYGIGHGGAAYVILVLAGTSCTKKSNQITKL
tara:strand:+ start:165 stop:383 length:219 start_codon:yes stop_codon:yes gene_type:complete